MKKTWLLYAFVCTFLSACSDKKDEPTPQDQESQTPTLAKKWQFKGSFGFVNGPSTNNINTPVGYFLWDDTYLEFVPSSTVLNLYNGGHLIQAGTYSVNNNKLTLSLDTLGYNPTRKFYIDSLTQHSLVFRDTTFFPNSFSFKIHRYTR